MTRLVALFGAAVCLFGACSAGLDVGDVNSPAGAADPGPPPAGHGFNITQLAGALFLHQFPAGGHAWLQTVDQPISVAELDGREPFSLPFLTTVRLGQCRLYLPPSCTPACASGSLCTGPGICTQLVADMSVDVGDFQVTGSQIAPLIRLWYSAPDHNYLADPAPGAQNLYAGGEQLTVSGGKGPFALQATWPAPMPVVVQEPPPDQPLHLPATDGFTLRWQPEGGSLMAILLSVNGPYGVWGDIRCLVPDSGSFTVPAALMAALPRPPRSVHYELERDEEVLVPVGLGPGVGMLVHAAFTAWQTGNDS